MKRWPLGPSRRRDLGHNGGGWKPRLSRAAEYATQAVSRLPTRARLRSIPVYIVTVVLSSASRQCSSSKAGYGEVPRCANRSFGRLFVAEDEMPEHSTRPIVSPPISPASRFGRAGRRKGACRSCAPVAFDENESHQHRGRYIQPNLRPPDRESAAAQSKHPQVGQRGASCLHTLASRRAAVKAHRAPAWQLPPAP